MSALNPEIIKDTKSLISFYQTNPRFKTAFDKIVANNINATYHGRPVKLYVEVMANVSSAYKRDYDQVKRISLYDKEGKVGELFKKIKPNDFFLLDAATKAAQQNLNKTSYSEQDINQINRIETDAKDNKEKRQAHQKRLETVQVLTKPPAEPEEPSLPSISNIPRPSSVRQFISGPRTYVSNVFRGGANAGRVVATGAGKAIGKIGIQTAIKAVAGAAAKLGASALLGAATGGVGFVVLLTTSFGGDFIKLIKWVVIILFAVILLFFVFQRGMKMNSLLPPYDIPTMGSVVGNGSCPTQAFIDQNRKPIPEACQYLNPNVNIFGDLTPEQINNYINAFWEQSKSSKEAFTNKVNQIVKASRAIGINPIVLLAYWKSESAFSTYPNASDLGCALGIEKFKGFDNQLSCALGTIDGNGEPEGAMPMMCARSVVEKDPAKKTVFDKACQILKGVRESTGIDTRGGFDTPNNVIYANFPISYPIKTFDDFAEAYGSKSPLLLTKAAREAGDYNGNCTHTYNDLLEVILKTGACIPSTSTPGNLASCKFTRAGESKPYQSSKLLGYFQEVSQKTSVPATVLAAFTRVESTVGKNVNGQGPYSISDYTDSDIDYINNYVNNNFPDPDVILTSDNSVKEIAKIVSATIPGTTKSVCPVSDNNALGLMQIQPPGTTGHDRSAVDKGAKNIGKAVDRLTLKDYCGIQSNLAIGAGFILSKLGAVSWDPAWSNDLTFLKGLAIKYYGADVYGTAQGCPTDSCSYGSDLYKSIQNCKPTTGGTPYTPPAGCVAARTVVPLLNEYDYPGLNNKCDGGVSTCGPTAGAIILQSLGIDSSIEKVTNDWFIHKAWNNSGYFGPTEIAAALNIEYPGQIHATGIKVLSASKIKELINDTGNAVMISVFYDNFAVNKGLLKQQMNSPSNKAWSCTELPQIIGNTPGGISLTNNNTGHMIAVYQVCEDRVYISDPVFAERYSVPIDQFNTAINLPDRGEAVTFTYLGQPSTQPQFAHPTSGEITLCYGDTTPPYYSENSPHHGLDIGNSPGTQIFAADNGTVEEVGEDTSRGNYIVINHNNGLHTYYMHLTDPENSLIKVTVEQRVDKSQLIGFMDTSGEADGPHLHFAVKKDGVAKPGYVDPALYLGITCKEKDSF